MSFRVDQNVSLTAHCLDLPTLYTDIGQLAAQVAYMDIEAPVQAGISAIQHCLIKKGLAQGFARVSFERSEQAKFGGRKPGYLAMVNDILMLMVDPYRSGFSLSYRDPVKGHTAQKCIDPGVQLSQAERLGR